VIIEKRGLVPLLLSNKDISYRDILVEIMITILVRPSSSVSSLNDN